MISRICKCHLWLVLALMTLAPTVYGQNSGSLSGVVQDPQGNVIPGAKVSAIETTKDQKFETTTSGEGTFSFPTLQPGNYKLTVEMRWSKEMGHECDL